MVEDGFDTLLLKGVAGLLSDLVDGLSWKIDPGATYDADEIALFLMRMLSGPDRAVTLTVYSLGDDPALSDSTKGLQVRSRGIPRVSTDATNIDSMIADALLGNYPVDLGTGVHINTLIRRSSVPLGVDELERSEVSSNYELGVYQPSTNRT